VYGLQRLLWEVRKYPALAAQLKNAPEELFEAYGVAEPYRSPLLARDFSRLLEMGTNPYLLYFYALQIGVDRADYYAATRAGNQ
jgi:hypothetical protein